MRIRVFKLGDRKDTCKFPWFENIWHTWLCCFYFLLLLDFYIKGFFLFSRKVMKRSFLGHLRLKLTPCPIVYDGKPVIKGRNRDFDWSSMFRIDLDHAWVTFENFFLNFPDLLSLSICRVRNDLIPSPPVSTTTT